MKELRAYSINFAGLSDGTHTFEYALDAKFLENFEGALIKNCQLQADVRLEKLLGLLTLHFKIHGTVEVECDICAEWFDLPITNEEQLIVKFVSEAIDSDEPDVLYLEQGSSFLNIAQSLYELVMLSIPIRKVHLDDAQGNPTCNPVVLQYLQKESAKKKKKSSAKEEGASDPNPIWQELQKLKNLN